MGLLNDDGTYKIDWDIGGDTQPGVGGTGGTGSLTPDAYNQIITDASSFSLTIDSGTRNAIQWIAAKDRILIGTTGGEWRMSGKSDKAITPTCYDIKPQTVWGSKDMQALVLHEAVLFVDFVGKKLRELVWDGTNERYFSPNLMLLAEHITASGGITTMAYQRNPDSIIWATLANGTLISCTYDKSQDVVAWARHPISLGITIDEDATAEYTPPVSMDYPLLRTTTVQDDPQLPHVTPVSTFEDLEMVRTQTRADVVGNYYLTNDIDASATADPDYNFGSGWIPISRTGYPTFKGTFDGCGYSIKNLYINEPGGLPGFGLFGQIGGGASIANLTVKDCDLRMGDNSGALGCCNTGWGTPDGNILIQNCHSSGNIYNALAAADNIYGGLIGQLTCTDSYKIEVYDCSSSVILDIDIALESANVGGLIGSSIGAFIYNCYATGNVINSSENNNPRENHGGLLGLAKDGTKIEYCYATGDVYGTIQVGGLVGFVDDDVGGYIRKCYSTGDVYLMYGVQDYGGGFCGRIGGTAVSEITDCYAWGNVTTDSGGDGVGGFIGEVMTPENVSQVYSIGLITCPGTYVGGLVALTDAGAAFSDTYWDVNTSGLDNSAEGIGHTTTWLKTKTNYPDTWDFDSIWRMAGTQAYIDEDNSLGMGFNSVCVIPGDTEDEIWVSVGRSINGTLVRYIERMKPRNWGSDMEDMFFVDSGLTYDSTSTSTITGLDHLEGETVSILADGAVQPSQVVSGGSINLTDAALVVQAGLSYTYKLKPMRMDQAYDGTSKGSIKKIYEAVVSFYKTLNARYGDGTDTYDWDWRETSAEYTTPPDLVTGDKVATVDGGFSSEDSFQIEGSDSLPCTVRCIIPRIDVTGR